MIKLHHSPNTRSIVILALLEELGVPYDVALVNIHAEGGLPENYRAIHPHKKVPAVEVNGVVVTERAAIMLYLCDLYPQAKLAPAVDDPRRAAYLTAMVYADAVLDPCIALRAEHIDYDARACSFGSFKDVLNYLEKQLTQHPYILGDTFSAADILFGAAVFWATDMLKVFPEKPVFRDYMNRVMSRPAFQRTIALDDKWAEQQKTA